jgi:hypothetical protein
VSSTSWTWTWARKRGSGCWWPIPGQGRKGRSLPIGPRGALP